MTANQPDRLSQIEAILLSIATTNQEIIQTNQETSQKIISNAKAIEALGDRTRELQEEAAVERQELREAVLRITDLVEGIANVTLSLDSDRPTILAKLNSIENKVNRLLEEKGNS